MADSGNPEVSRYLNNSSYGNSNLLNELFNIVKQTVPEAREEYKWDMIIFSKSNIFCYIKDGPEHVTLGFFSNESLKKVDVRLDGMGKTLCHISYRSEKEIKKKVLQKILLTLTRSNIFLIYPVYKYLMLKLFSI